MYDLKLTYFISKLSGLWLFNKFNDIDYWYLIESIIVRLLEMLHIIMEIYRLASLSNLNKKNLILNIIFILKSVVNNLMNLLHIYSQFRHEQLWKLLIFFKTRKTKYSDLVLVYNLVLLIIISVGIIISLINNVDRYLNLIIFQFIIIQIVNFFNNLKIYQFSMLMENLVINLKDLNKEIKNFKKQLYLKLYYKFLIKKHDDIINQARLINFVFSWQNLLLCLTSITGFIANLYNLCISIVTVNINISLSAVTVILFIIYYIGNILTVVYWCENFRNQVIYLCIYFL